MILAFGLLTLLVAATSGAAGIKGGRRIIQEPAVIQDVSQPHLHVGKGGAGGALHHTAVVQDPLSGSPVVVEKVSRLGSGGGIKGGLNRGVKGGYGLAASPFGQRRLYRIGQSQYPFGLLGSDYYSYPNSLLTAPRRVLRRKTVASPNLSGLRPVGFGGRKGGVIVDPTTSQFSIGDAQIKTGGYGLRRNLYRTGLSPVPYGLSGLDYYSYPRQLLTQRRLADDFGLGQTRILSGGSAFTAGDSQIRGPIVATPIDQVSVLGDGLGDGFGQRKITTTTVTNADPLSVALGQGPITQTTVTKSAGGLGGLRGGQIILSGGQGIGGLRRVKSRPAAVVVSDGGFGQRQVVVAKSAPVVQAPIIAASTPIVQAPVQAPIQVLQAPVVAASPIRRIISRRPGEVFLQQVSRPRVAQRFATLARPSQVVVPVSQQRVISSPILSSPQVISQVKTSPGLIGRRLFNGSPRMVYVDGGNRFLGIDIIGGSRIGDPRFGYGQLAYGGLAGRFATLGGLSQARIPVSGFSSLDGQGSIDAGQTLLSPAPITVVSASPFRKSSPLLAAAAPVAKTVTQQEVVGPLGDRQVVTTVTKSDPLLAGSKIGGLTAGGLAGVGQGHSVVTQEEVVGPAGDSQILTTVTNAGPSKIGGLAAASPLGFKGLGSSLSAPAKTITQEEVVGPLGDRQVVTTVTKSDPLLSGSKIGGLAAASPLGFKGLGSSLSAPSKTITQEEVVGPLGDRQVVTTVTKSDPLLSGSKIGGLAAGSPLGFGGLGSSLSAPAKTITQQEVVGPLGDRQVVTTVTKSDPLLSGSKIGGLAAGGLAGVGQGPSIVTQEEVVGPAGDPQILTTVTNAGSGLGSGKIGGLASGGLLGLSGVGQQIVQDPIETTVIQEPIGGSILSSPLSQSLVDPLGSGQSQIVVDDVSGTVTEVSQAPLGISSGGLGDSLIQQNIADAVVQESISSGLGSGLGSLLGYDPRISFLSQYPYDVPNNQLLQSVLASRPVIQQQQEVEQILVK